MKTIVLAILAGIGLSGCIAVPVGGPPGEYYGGYGAYRAPAVVVQPSFGYYGYYGSRHRSWR